MIGTTLSDIRHHIESLATPTGRYYLVCARTGDRPVPADGLYFDCRPTARAAATATEQYRSALRRYDTQLPCYDVIVCEQSDRVRSPTDEQYPADACGSSPATEPGDQSDGEGSPVDFCHTVAGVVFETIANSTHTGVQSAIMDRYLDLAETVDSPDELCLQLIQSIATELDERLSADEQADLLRTAAAHLPAPTSPDPASDPLESALDALESVSLLRSYRIDQRSVSCGSTTWELWVRGYQLDVGPDRLVTLPLVVELFRRLSTVALMITDAERTAGSTSSWRLTLTASPAQTNGPLSVVEVGP